MESNLQWWVDASGKRWHLMTFQMLKCTKTRNRIWGEKNESWVWVCHTHHRRYADPNFVRKCSSSQRSLVPAWVSAEAFNSLTADNRHVGRTTWKLHARAACTTNWRERKNKFESKIKCHKNALQKLRLSSGMQCCVPRYSMRFVLTLFRNQLKSQLRMLKITGDGWVQWVCNAFAARTCLRAKWQIFTK